ncbi:NAD(P)-dependent oxidoreductase [Thermophilibacter mediterraneus]|uniref:NAD(P)-dependent oxidoreductase n=1 Tax=Thermophilibacter mediterraneus TaxID=1871031 RepID=UPI000930758A|nr:NAD(P)-dependent oxidoreductase [Thermophilibacter mediterraneus]
MSHTHIRKVAFIGTGIMGARIAGHILDAGYDVTVSNRTREKAEDLLARGAHWADTPAEAAADADVVFTMVGYPSDVEDVYLSTDGLIRRSKRGAWLVDLTTSSPQLARDIHDAAEVEDKHAFDCPVTGGEQGAIDGTLTLIIGAAEKDVEPLLPLLETFSSRRFYFDQPGGGQTAKLCNQVSLASCMVGYADAVALAEQAGIDVDRMLEVLANGTGGSGASRTLAPRSVAGDFKPGFLVEHLRKDIGLAISASEDLEITLPGAETAFTLFDMLCQIGGSRMGTQAITLLYDDEATCAAAGLDWSLLDQGEEGDDHECHCGHDHGDDHECHCGHDHGDDHECCGGHGHGDDHECHCHDHEH